MDFKSMVLKLVDLYGYWAVFFTMFIDTLGIPMPSKTMLTLSGYFSQMGILNLYWIFIVAMAGTLGGFASGYNIGRIIGTTFIEKYGHYGGITPEKMARIEKWFNKYGLYAIFIAYFLPVARSAVPYLSGINKVPFIPAISMAVLGAACWIITLISLGFIIGRSRMKLDVLLNDYYLYLIAGVVVLIGMTVWGKIRIKKKHSKAQ